MKATGILLSLLFVVSVSAYEEADYVLHNGAVYTVDASRSWTQAIAIKANEIVFVGLNSDARKYTGKRTRVIDLNKAMVLPGFQDSHIHPVTAALKSSMCSLRGLSSRQAYLEKIEQCVKNNSTAPWVHGTGWSHSYFDKDNQSTKFLLGNISAGIPITLASYDGHSLWANSKALEAAGITAQTPDVDAGTIVRLPNSTEPSGLFWEDQALDAIMKAKPPYSEQEVYKALISAQKYLNSLGITTVQDAMVEVDKNSMFGVLPSYLLAESKKKN